MPQRSKKGFRLTKVRKLRFIKKNVPKEHHSSDDDYRIDSDEMIVDDNIDNINWTDKNLLNHIGDLFQVCLNQCNVKTLSTFIYMVLRYFNCTWRDIDSFMTYIDGLRCITANKWARIFINGDFNEFMKDGRGGKRGDAFFDLYPELEIDAKLFVADACSRKSGDFKSLDLANFIDSSYYKLTGTKKCENELIRSERMCRLYLRQWGYRSDLNTQRPYFKGHDRVDVLAYRETFLDYFLSKKDHYYLLGPGDHPSWCIPTQEPRILICHDETTFRSGEVTSRRWISNETTSFFSKGRGRSLMLSDFMVCHPSGPYFYLNDKEWQKAIIKYPDLLENDCINYMDHTASAAINVGGNLYFDNETILSQFHRLFKMLEFKTQYKGHRIDIIVDNARTHTACQYYPHDFGKNIGSRCPADAIEYDDDNGVKKIMQCYFQSGPNKNKSKGLFKLAKELHVVLPRKCSLPQLREILRRHPAFEIKTKLENLAEQFNINIIYSPKFHCELNAIEGMWCNMKRFVRERNDQQYGTMLLLIEHSKTHFVDIELYKKLFRRFWNACEAYRNGKSYTDVLQLFFSNHCKGEVVSHRRIENSNIDTSQD